MNIRDFVKENKNFCFGLGSIESSNDRYCIDQALDLGIRMFDTAEEYGESEKVLGESIASCRDDVFVVTKVLPTNVKDLPDSCHQSLKNLRIDKIDLYLVHGYDDSLDPRLVIEKMSEMKGKGLIANWGVSHYEHDAIEALKELDGDCDANQILYSLNGRNFENQLKATHQKHGITTMCYNVLRGIYKDAPLFRDQRLVDFCLDRNITPAKLLVNWVCRHQDLVPVVFSRDRNHLAELLEPLEDLDEYVNDIESMFTLGGSNLLPKRTKLFDS